MTKQTVSAALLKALPHRPPFLLLDSVELGVALGAELREDGACTKNAANPEGASSPSPVLGRGTLLLRDDNPLVNSGDGSDGGTLEPVAYAEIMAQCFAAVAGSATTNGTHDASGPNGAEHAEGTKPALGYLAALRDVRVYGQARVGQTLHVTVRVAATLGAVHVVEGAVHCGATLLAEGQCKIFVAEAP